MSSKHCWLNTKTPSEAAEIVGTVEKANYFAHSIREIQNAILATLNMNYHITTHVFINNNKARILFYDTCCEIWLPCECEEMDDIKIRQILAHELGHLIYNFDKLKTPEILEKLKRTDNEELRAWEFAFHLVKKKSDEHRSNKAINKHIFTKDEILSSITALVRKKRPTILNDLMRILK